MLLQIRYGGSCIVGDVLLRELQELVDEDQRRTTPLEVLHGDKSEWGQPRAAAESN